MIDSQTEATLRYTSLPGPGRPPGTCLELRSAVMYQRKTWYRGAASPAFEQPQTSSGSGVSKSPGTANAPAESRTSRTGLCRAAAARDRAAVATTTRCPRLDSSRGIRVALTLLTRGAHRHCARRRSVPRRSLRWGALLLAAAFALAGCAPGGAEEAPGRVAVDRAARAVSFPATVHAGAFQRRVLGMPGYHLVVWQGGSAAPAALFRAAVTDVQVLDALESLGAEPGNALGMATWDEREDPRSPAPERVIAGPPVEVLVRVPGRKKPLPKSSRRGLPCASAATARTSRSGTPAASSASTPAREARSATPPTRCATGGGGRLVSKFGGVLPPEGTAVTILLRLLPEEPGAAAKEGPPEAPSAPAVLAGCNLPLLKSVLLCEPALAPPFANPSTPTATFPSARPSVDIP